MNIDVSGWKLVGETANAKAYEVAADVLLFVPNLGASDDEASARANAGFQNAYWKRHGRRGVGVVVFDNLVAQDKAARVIYQSEIDPAWTVACGIVASTLLARAMANFFVGFGASRVPSRIFSDLHDALAWAREQNNLAKASAP